MENKVENQEITEKEIKKDYAKENVQLKAELRAANRQLSALSVYKDAYELATKTIASLEQTFDLAKSIVDNYAKSIETLTNKIKREEN